MSLIFLFSPFQPFSTNRLFYRHRGGDGKRVLSEIERAFSVKVTTYCQCFFCYI